MAILSRGTASGAWRCSPSLAAAAPASQDANCLDNCENRDGGRVAALGLTATRITGRRGVTRNPCVLIATTPARAAAIELAGIDAVLADEATPRRAEVVVHVDARLTHERPCGTRARFDVGHRERGSPGR